MNHELEYPNICNENKIHYKKYMKSKMKDNKFTLDAFG